MDLNKQVESESQVRHTAPLDDRILTLRRAIFDASGADKDVTQGIAASFMKYNNGSPVTIEFSTSLSAAEARWAFSATKKNMEARYEASGYGWDDDDKKKELTEKGARFLLVRAAPTPTPTPTTTGAEDVEATEPGPLVGFVHFRFTVQGEVLEKMAGDNCLHVFDIHLEEGRGKGLGKHLLVLLELIARREKMGRLTLPVQLGDSKTTSWLKHIGRGFEVDPSLAGLGFDAEVEGFHIYAKVFQPNPPTPAPAPASVSASVSAPPALASPVPAPATVANSAPAPSVPVGSEPASMVPGDDNIVEGGWLCL